MNATLVAQSGHQNFSNAAPSCAFVTFSGPPEQRPASIFNTCSGHIGTFRGLEDLRVASRKAYANRVKYANSDVHSSVAAASRWQQ